ncbi:MAG: FAD-dependent oxidoreductase, partial [Silvibacterium sp.]
MSANARLAAEETSFDVLVIGAGPTGMACAIEAQRAGFRSVLVDKGCLCNSIFHYPSH